MVSLRCINLELPMTDMQNRQLSHRNIYIRFLFT